MLPIVLVLLATTTASAVVTTAPGYLARTIATPDAVQGGVVRHGEAILVGQGAFGAGGEYVVRIEPAGVTVVATGFNSLGGFDVEPNGTLLLVDNGAELPGAVTGDTLFEIPDAVTRTTSLSAAGQEILPPGSLPDAQDVLAIPETLLVTDGAGPGLGRVLRVSDFGVPTDFVTGLDYLGGLAFGAGGTVFVAQRDAAFAGTVLAFDYIGFTRRTVAADLSGAFGLALDRDGATVLVSDGGSGTVLAVAPDGTITERARGFVFATDLFFDGRREELLALDVGASGITVICADADTDGICDADDPCSAGRPIHGLRARLGRRLSINGRVATPGPTALPPIAPASTGIRVLIEGGSGALLDAVLPGGASWRRRGRRWIYADRRGEVAGITRLVLRERADELAFVVRGRAGPPLPPAGDVALRFSLGLDATAVRRTCAVATPACTLVRRGSALRCA